MKDSFKILLLIYILMIISVIFDVPIFRQVLGFVYLTFVPGFLFSQLLSIYFDNFIYVFIFSFSLSISLLMFFTVLLNELFLLLGFIKPLSFFLIFSSFCLFILIIFLLSKERHIDYPYFNFKSSFSNNFFYGLFILFYIPISIIIGILYQNINIIIITINIIAILLFIIPFIKKFHNPYLYLFIIFTVSLSLLYQTSLLTKYNLGYDINLENYVFQLTRIKGYWTNFLPLETSVTSNYNSMLSITILPTIYENILNIKSDFIFKIIYPFIFCLVPLTLYKTYETLTNSIISFLSVLFFISNETVFYGVEPLSLCRQIIGELFFVVLILLIVEKKIDPRKKRILFIIFSSSLIISHYSLSILFLFNVIFLYIFLYRDKSKKMINGFIVGFLIISNYLWYFYISNSVFESLITVFKIIYQNFLYDFFNPYARSAIIPQIMRESRNIVFNIHRILFYIVHFFILIGIFETIVERIRRKNKLNKEFHSISLFNMFILVLCLVIPNFAPSINITRFRAISLMSLSLFYALGSISCFNFLTKFKIFFTYKMKEKNIEIWGLKLASVVLMAFFLFQTGFINYIMNDKPVSFSLDINRMKLSNDLEIKIMLYNAYIPEHDVFSAIWLSENADNVSIIYADFTMRAHKQVLTSYGLITPVRTFDLLPNTIASSQSYIYLRYLNIVEGIVNTREGALDLNNFSYIKYNNKIYSNGGSDIYFVTR